MCGVLVQPKLMDMSPIHQHFFRHMSSQMQRACTHALDMARRILLRRSLLYYCSRLAFD